MMTAKQQPRSSISALALSMVFYLGLLTHLNAAPDTSNLVERSPFMPPAINDASNARRTEPDSSRFPEIDFVGYSGVEGNWEVALFFVESQTVHWMKTGQTIESIELLNFNPQNASVLVKNNQATKTLRINDTKPTAMDAPPPITQRAPQTTSSAQPANENSNNNDTTEHRRVIPRRRIILPRTN